MTIFLSLGYLVLSFALQLIFKKANVAGWKAWVPFLNFMECCNLVGRKKGHALLLFIPIVNFFILAGLTIDLARSFGKLTYLHSIMAVIGMPIYLLYLGLRHEIKYDGPVIPKELEMQRALKQAMQKKDRRKYRKLQAKNPFRKSWGREWVESLTFAVFAAAFIRMFLVEAYAIPTSSMEGSLLVGDRLFVSKFQYGIRLPMTVAMVPLVHNQLPLIGGKSYFTKPNLKYRRLPAWESIDVGDQIVFNWPVGDSVFYTATRSWSAEQVRTLPYAQQQVAGTSLVTHPVDKRDHYVKRCMGTPGDVIQIIDRQVVVNGQVVEDAKGVQYKYKVVPANGTLNEKMLEKLGVSLRDSPFPPQTYHLTQEQVKKIKTAYPDISITLEPGRGGQLFPDDSDISSTWTIDNYGPITIPAAGTNTKISRKNIALYKRIIDVYENNDLEIKGEQILINGRPADSYTFKQNYYWGMGDNRHNSEDSRSWGFIPEDHIVGKPIFILFSTKHADLKNGVHWDRTLSLTKNYN